MTGRPCAFPKRLPWTLTVVDDEHQASGDFVGVLAADLDALEAEVAWLRERVARRRVLRTLARRLPR